MKVKHLLVIILIVVISALIVNRVQLHNETAVSGKIPELLFSITGEGENGSKLNKPVFAIPDDKGRIFVSDTGNHRVAIFNKKGRLLSEISGPASGQQFVYPYGIGLAGDRILVADTGAGALYEFNSKGDYLGNWLEGKGEFRPTGVFIGKEGVYVSDAAGKQVLVFSTTGKMLKAIKPGNVSLGALQGIAAGNDGTIVVADGGNYNIKIISPAGELVSIFDGGPDRPLTTVKGLAVDKKGLIYAADTLSGIIRIFDEYGNSLDAFGQAGNKKMFRFPTGLSVDEDGLIYVADEGKDEVQVWGYK